MTKYFGQMIAEQDLNDQQAVNVVEQWIDKYLKTEVKDIIEGPPKTLNSAEPTLVSQIISFFSGYDGDSTGGA